MGDEMETCSDYDSERLKGLLTELFRIVKQLEEMFPGRKFTPDGHLVGSLGEALAAFHYDLRLAPSSYPDVDAFAGERQVQIKATFGSRCVLFHPNVCECVLVLRLGKIGDFEEVFNGDSKGISDELRRCKPSKRNAKIPLSLSKLRALNAHASGKLPRREIGKVLLEKRTSLSEWAGKIEFYEGFDPRK